MQLITLKQQVAINTNTQVQAEIEDLINGFKSWCDLHNRVPQEVEPYFIYQKLFQISGGNTGNPPGLVGLKRHYLNAAYQEIINHLNNGTMEANKILPMMPTDIKFKKDDGKHSPTNQVSERVKPLSPTQMSW